MSSDAHDPQTELDRRIQQAADETLRDGLRLAEFLKSEFDRLRMSGPVVMHALAALMAGMLIDADTGVSVLELQEGKIFTDAERMQHFTDEVFELAAQGRDQRKFRAYLNSVNLNEELE